MLTAIPGQHGRVDGDAFEGRPYSPLGNALTCRVAFEVGEPRIEVASARGCA